MQPLFEKFLSVFELSIIRFKKRSFRLNYGYSAFFPVLKRRYAVPLLEIPVERMYGSETAFKPARGYRAVAVLQQIASAVETQDVDVIIEAHPDEFFEIP